jgi:hypothetical protein
MKRNDLSTNGETVSASAGSPESPLPGISLKLLVRHAALYGGIAGVLSGAWMILEYALGFQTVKPEIGRITALAALIFPVGAMILGVMRWRDRVLGGSMKFTQAFGAALAIGLVFSVVFAGAAWLHAGVLVPDLVITKIEAYATALRAAGKVPVADIDKWLETERARANAGTYAYQYFSGSLIQSLVIALMAAISVRKKPLACTLETNPPAANA